MGWKQPIDTQLIYEFGDDYQAHALFVFLLLRANNERRSVGVGKKYIVVERGQVLFSRALFGKYLGWADSKSERVLKRLCEIHQKVNKQTNSNGTIVSILNYDELTRFEQVNEQQVNKKRTGSEQQVNTNKNDKNDKNDKNVKKLTSEDVTRIVTAYNLAKGRSLKALSLEVQKSVEYWLDVHPVEDMVQAIKMLPRMKGDFFAGMELSTLFRQKNAGGACDYIEQILTSSKQDPKF